MSTISGLALEIVPAFENFIKQNQIICDLCLGIWNKFQTLKFLQFHI